MAKNYFYIRYHYWNKPFVNHYNDKYSIMATVFNLSILCLRYNKYGRTRQESNWFMRMYCRITNDNLLNCEEVRDEIEKHLTSRENFSAMIIFIPIITHLIVISFTLCFEKWNTHRIQRFWNCIIGWSSTAQNNSLCNHMWW